MREVNRRILNIAFYALFTLILVSFQTSLWPQWLGPIPPPYFWIPTIVYLALYQPPLKAVVTIYVTSLVISSMSSMSAGLLMLNHLLIFTILLALKSRVFWPGTSYFMLATAIASFAFSPFLFLLSIMIEANPMPYPRVLPWLTAVLLTPILSPFLYNIFIWTDRTTKIDQAKELGADFI